VPPDGSRSATPAVDSSSRDELPGSICRRGEWCGPGYLAASIEKVEKRNHRSEREKDGSREWAPGPCEKKAGKGWVGAQTHSNAVNCIYGGKFPIDRSNGLI
jgi:hypothetical protein